MESYIYNSTQRPRKIDRSSSDTWVRYADSYDGDERFYIGGQTDDTEFKYCTPNTAVYVCILTRKTRVLLTKFAELFRVIGYRDDPWTFTIDLY